MQKIISVLILLNLFLAPSCKSQNNKQAAGSIDQNNKVASQPLAVVDSTGDDKYYPFTVHHDGTYTITASIESKKLFSQYNPLFVHYGYSGNGYSWEGIIKQILAKENPALLGYMEFDSEAGMFFAN